MIEYQISTSFFEWNENHITTWLKSVIKSENFVEGEIGYVFCNDSYLHDINLQFLNHDTLTDIITFPMTQEISNIISGTIYISIDRVKENAQHYRVSFLHELSRVMVHGILHLMGYDDHTDDDVKLMRQKEDYYLSLQPLK